MEDDPGAALKVLNRPARPRIAFAESPPTRPATVRRPSRPCPRPRRRRRSWSSASPTERSPVPGEGDERQVGAGVHVDPAPTVKLAGEVLLPGHVGMAVENE